MSSSSHLFAFLSGFLIAHPFQLWSPPGIHSVQAMWGLRTFSTLCCPLSIERLTQGDTGQMEEDPVGRRDGETLITVFLPNEMVGGFTPGSCLSPRRARRE